MKVLVIASIPTPPILVGNSKCIFEYCKMLYEKGVDVHYLYIEGKTKQTFLQRKELKQYWGSKLYIYRRRLWLEAVPRILNLLKSKVIGYNNVDDLYPIGLTSFVKSIHAKEQFDSVIVNYLSLSKLFLGNHSFKKILYTHDVFSFKKKRLKLNDFWFDLTPNEEAKGLERADCILSIQSNESIYYSYLCPNKEIYTTYSYFHVTEQPMTNNDVILFLASKNTVNYNGIYWFINEVLPIIIQQVPNVMLTIGGSICEMLEPTSNVKLLGRIDKEEKFYEMGDIAINPIFQGTGLKIKTFEALSFGKITIVHPHSMEGIYQLENAPIFIGESAKVMAQHIINILIEKDKRKKISNQSINYIKSLNKYVENVFMKAVKNSKNE